MNFIFFCSCLRINRSPFSFPQEKSLIFIGSKTTSLMGIDLQSGQPIGSFGTLKSSGVGYCKPDEKGDGLYAEEEECESDIDERPEDLLFFGQTGESKAWRINGLS
jgi:serine/threonine-protein kinase/endoribonuclease IRE1